MLIKLLTFTILGLLMVACNDKPTDGSSPQDPGNLTVTPGTLQLTILSPATDGTSLSSYSVISGHCGIPGGPIEVSGAGVSHYSICQNDYTWASPISAVNASEGAVQYSVKLKDKLLTSESPVVNRSFIKRDGICLDPDNRGKLFANLGVADGTNVPYKICTPTQFSNIRFYPNKKFVIAQNIDFSALTVSPIGVAFSGELDGQGFILKDFIIKDIGGTGISVGLFRYAHNAVIKNLSIQNVSVDASQRVGIIAGDWRGGGLLENIKIQGSVKATTMAGGLIGLGNSGFSLMMRNVKTKIDVTSNNYTGGVIGYINTNNGSFNIENSEFHNNVIGNAWTGGVAGHVLENDTNFTNVIHRGSVSSLTEKVGGLIGEVAGGTFTQVKHFGSVGTTKNNVDTNVGGLIGVTSGPVTINGATVVSTISAGGNYTGGLVGRFYSGSINNTVARVTINVQDNQFFAPQRFAGGLLGGTSLATSITDSHAVVNMNTIAYYVGGLVGNLIGDDSSILRSWSSGEVRGRVSHVGGLVGNFTGNSISQSFSRANITLSGPTPNSYIGGLVGMANSPSGSYSRLYSSGNIVITDGTPDIVGGVFGYVRGLSVKQAYASGNISGARNRIGGIAGYLWAPLSESFFSGTINAKLRYVGGLVGVAFQSPITDSFVKSSGIKGSGEVGGLVGWTVEGNNSSIERTYFSGGIVKNGSSSLDEQTFGPLVGIKDPNTLISNSFFDTSSTFIREADASIMSPNTLGTGLTLASLRNSSSYSGFNFVSSTTTFNWQMPITGYKLPFKTTDHLYAIQDWLTEPNQGFVLPVTYTDDPVNEIQPEFFDSLQNILTSFSQYEFDIISSTTPPTTVTQGQLQMSFVSPAIDGTPISTKLLIHGECGLPGGKISLNGSFVVNTVCQSNYRWAVIVDATSRPAGNLTLSAKLHNLGQTTASSTVTRILNKGSSICSDPLAIKGIFANSHLGGNGSTMPYKICHVGHLKNIAYYPSSKFELENDIDFGGNSFDPILTAFRGTLDGKNFSLRNLVINKPTGIPVGLFSAVQNATIKDLTIEKFNIRGNERVGILAGDWRGTGTIQNVKIKNGTVQAIQTVGSLIGLANTSSALNTNGLTVENVTVTGNNNTAGVIGFISSSDGSYSAQNLTLKDITVNGLGNVGGLIGISYQPGMLINNVTASNITVTALGEKIGGLFGNIHSATISNVNISGEINADKDAVEVSAGGVVGEASTSLNLSSIQWMGAVNSGSDNVGGIVGKATGLTATNLVSSGILAINDDRYNSVRKNIGGLAGLILGENSSVENSSSSMTINANSHFTGGLFGRFEGEFGVIKNSYFIGIVNARTSFVGGLAGIFDGKDLWDSYSTGAVNVTNPTPNANIGGLVGYANSKSANYKRLRASGNVTITNGLADYVGGLIGFFRAGTIEDSSATGNVSGGRIANGGLIGMMRGSMDRCYSTGNVVASGRHNGGLVGYLNLQGYIRDSFATGNVEGSEETGGLVGHVNTTHGSSAVLRSYSYGQVSKSSASTAPDVNFGPVYGTVAASAQVDPTTIFYLTSKLNPLHNNSGTAIADAFASEQSSYPGMDFFSTPGWRIPAPTTNVPGYGTSYPYPILTWIGEGTSTYSYGISGTISGLQYGSVTLALNGGQENVTVNSPATIFAFTSKLEPGMSYTVAISQNPASPSITCVMTNGSGSMGNADVTNITVSCPTFQSIAIGADDTMPSGSGQSLVINGTLSNTVVVNLTGIASLTSSNSTNFNLTDSTLVALSAGSTTLAASFLSLNASQIVSAVAPPADPTNPIWQGGSPSSVLGLNAQWSRSATGTIASQRIDYFSNGTCSGSPVSTKNLAAGVSSDSFTGADTLTYSFKVTAVDSSTLSAASVCSNAMQIILPTPSPISSLTASAIWINGNSPVSSPLLSWVNPSEITSIEVALGNTSGGTQVLSWTANSVITSYTYTNLSTLSNCAPYYASVRTVNQFNKKSIPVTHAGFRWDNSIPGNPGAIVNTGTPTAMVAPLATWGASIDNCELNSYEIAIGTSAGSTDVSGGWINIGNVTSYQPTSGAGGMTFTLSEGTDYFTVVRSRDQAGNYSQTTSSAAWRLQSNGLAKTFWFDASERASVRDSAGRTPDDPGFLNFVRTWEDISATASHDAFSPGASNDPGFESTSNKMTFSGGGQYLNVPTSVTLDNGIFTHKNIFVSFQTPTDVASKQVIYEQGDRRRGINLYLFNGKLYCGFWNTNNDGDGAQNFISTTSTNNLSPGTVYHAALVYDYSNYTGPTGPNGSVKCYLNNTQMGATLSTTSRLFAHAGSTGIGADNSGSRYHDELTSKTGYYFKGKIMEAIMFQDLPSAADISTSFNTLMTKWSSGELSSPGNLALLNNSTLATSASASWTAISSTYFNTSHYLMAIGTTTDSTDILFWTDIGKVTSYTAQDGINGVSLSLAYETDYYIMIKAVDAVGNESQTAVSSVWRVLPPGSTTLADTFLQLDGSDFPNVLDGAGVAAGQGSFANVVATWRNKINTAINNFTQGTVSRRPVFNTSLRSAIFDKSNDFLTSPAETNLGNSTVNSKTLTMVFATNNDVTTRQFLFELGDRNRGLSIYIENGELYCHFHQNSNGGDGAQVPVWINSPVSTSSSYVVSLYLDYTNYTGANGPNGTVGCVVNGVSAGTATTTSRWYATNNPALIGYRADARWHNGNASQSGDYFGGEIMEVQMTNSWPSNGATGIMDLHNALMNKW
jgi:hypothetical protein